MSDSHATPEQLDYLRWYRGGENEYPVYDTDAYGRVMHPGYAKEISLDELLSGMTEDEESFDVPIEPVKRGNVPSPEDALSTFFGDARLATLSRRERQAFILTHVCAMWPREVAAYLSIHVESVKTMLKRARKKLQR